MRSFKPLHLLSNLTRTHYFFITVLAIVSVRFALSAINKVGMYHGGNEAWYIMIAKGYQTDPWTPNLYGYPFYDTPPLLTYLIYASSTVFGWNELSARMPSMLAWLSIAFAVYLWWQRKNDQTSATFYAVTALILPWMFFWAGRAQTDMLLAAAVVWYALLTQYGQKGATLSGLVFALGLMAKQPMLLALPILFFWPRQNRLDAVVSTFAGTVVVGSWWYLQWLFHPAEVTRSVLFHTGERAAFAGNAANTVLIGLLIASGGLALYYLWRYNLKNSYDRSISGLTWAYANRGPWIAFLLYALFAVVNSPLQHEYYTVPAIALIPLLLPPVRTLSKGIPTGMTLTMMVCLVFSLYSTQELGDDPLDDAFADHNITHVQSGLTQQAMYYGVDYHQVDDACTVKENGTYLCRQQAYDQRYCYRTAGNPISPTGMGIEICPNHCVFRYIYNNRLWVNYCGSFMGDEGTCWQPDGEYMQMVLKRCEE